MLIQIYWVWAMACPPLTPNFVDSFVRFGHCISCYIGLNLHQDSLGASGGRV